MKLNILLFALIISYAKAQKSTTTNISEPCTTGNNGQPCQNGGVATGSGGLAYCACQCNAGYSGDNCETNIDDCDPDPCQNEAPCTDGVDDYTCDCSGTSFTGKNCDTGSVIDKEAASPACTIQIINDGTTPATNTPGEAGYIDEVECAQARLDSGETYYGKDGPAEIPSSSGAMFPKGCFYWDVNQGHGGAYYWNAHESSWKCGETITPGDYKRFCVQKVCPSAAADSCSLGKCIDDNKRTAMGMDKTQTEDRMSAYQAAQNGKKLTIATDKGIRSVADDSIDKQRKRLKEFSRLGFTDGTVIEFRFEKKDIPTGMFKKEARIKEVRVFRTNQKHVLAKIEKSKPLYTPLETGEKIEFEINGEDYKFEQIDENTIQITWPNEPTQTLSVGATLKKSGLIVTAGSVVIEQNDEECVQFENSDRTCPQIFNNYNELECCGAADGQCAQDVLEYKCADCCPE